MPEYIKFETGKLYGGEDGLEIRIIKRTEKTVTFVYAKPNWLERDTNKEFRRKIDRLHKEYESIGIGRHWSDPRIPAINKIQREEE